MKIICLKKLKKNCLKIILDLIIHILIWIDFCSNIHSINSACSMFLLVTRPYTGDSYIQAMDELIHIDTINASSCMCVCVCVLCDASE